MKQQTKNQNEKLLTIEELSLQVGFGKTFINKARNQFGLPFYKIGGAVRFKMSDVNNWLEERKVILL